MKRILRNYSLHIENGLLIFGRFLSFHFILNFELWLYLNSRFYFYTYVTIYILMVYTELKQIESQLQEKNIP